MSQGPFLSITTDEYDWIGSNSKGESRGGRGPIGRTLALWVERKFDLGWKRLTVRRVDTSDRDAGWPLVAEIRVNDDGVRTWWSET